MRIAGVNIPDNKKIETALTYLYGIGFSLARKIVEHAKIDAAKRAKELTLDEVNRIQEYIEKNFKV